MKHYQKYKSTDSRLNKVAIQFLQELLGRDNSFKVENIQYREKFFRG